MKAEVLGRLKDIVGEEFVITAREAMEDYLVNETCPPIRPKPADDVVLVKPKSCEEVSRIIKLANEWMVPVFPRGGGTGLVGGCIPTEDGIVLSLERLNKVLEVDVENLMVVAEAGVTLGRLMEAAEKAGLFFPPHPGDESAQLGGLIACNAGGTRAVMYGVVRNYVRGFEVVIGTGDILRLGGKILKNVAGYDLMQLIIGSGGTLGVITKAILRLYPKFKETTTLLVPFEDRHDALRAVPSIIKDGTIPLALEYVEREVMERSARDLGKKWPVKVGQALLYIIVTGEDKGEVYRKAEKIDSIVRKYNAIDTLIVEGGRDQEDVLSIRSNIYLTLKPYILDIIDGAVPPANMAKLMDLLDEVAKKFGTRFPLYGHAGDGNVHVHILTKEAGGVDMEHYEEVRRRIYEAVLSLEGTITGEHGVGKLKVKDMERYLGRELVEIMRNIKKVFDPNNILNPGAMFIEA